MSSALCSFSCERCCLPVSICTLIPSKCVDSNKCFFRGLFRTTNETASSKTVFLLRKIKTSWTLKSFFSGFFPLGHRFDWFVGCFVVCKIKKLTSDKNRWAINKEIKFNTLLRYCGKIISNKQKQNIHIYICYFTFWVALLKSEMKIYMRELQNFQNYKLN